MSFFQKVRLFLRLLAHFLHQKSSQSLSQTILNLGSSETIELGQGVYFRVPKAEVRLISVSGDSIQSVHLSMDDSRQIFESIQRACERNEIAEIEIGDLSWKTDCRVQSDPETVTISFKRGWEWTRVNVRRQDVAAAAASFAKRFEFHK